MTVDESKFHHFDLETKWQSMEGHHAAFLKEKKARTKPLAGKLWEQFSGMPRVAYWVDILPQRETIIVFCCIQLL
jgi:hypothetical protein